MEITAVNQVPTTTWNSVNRKLFDYIGVTGNITLTVKNRDTETFKQILVPITSWLRDADNPSDYPLEISPLTLILGSIK